MSRAPTLPQRVHPDVAVMADHVDLSKPTIIMSDSSSSGSSSSSSDSDSADSSSDSNSDSSQPAAKKR